MENLVNSLEELDESLNDPIERICFSLQEIANIDFDSEEPVHVTELKIALADIDQVQVQIRAILTMIDGR